MNREQLLWIVFAMLVCSCAMSTEPVVLAASVRVCSYPTGAIQGVVYITPEDDRSQCVVVQTSGPATRSASLTVTSCAELGWSRDGARTLEFGTQVAAVVATVEGRVEQALDAANWAYDLRVTLAGPDGVRVVHAEGTVPMTPVVEAGCYRLATP